MTTFIALQTGVASALDSRGAETVAVSLIVLLGKVWDRAVSRRKDRERTVDRMDLNRRLDEHATSDLHAFSKIDTALVLLDKTLNNGMSDDVREIKDRLGRMEERWIDSSPSRRR